MGTREESHGSLTDPGIAVPLDTRDGCWFWPSELSQGVQGRDLNQESSIISPLNKVHYKKPFPRFHRTAVISQEPSQQGFFLGFLLPLSLSSLPELPSQALPEVSPSPQAQMDPLLQPRWIPCAPAESQPGLEPQFSLAGQALGEGGTGELQIPSLGSNPLICDPGLALPCVCLCLALLIHTLLCVFPLF